MNITKIPEPIKKIIKKTWVPTLYTRSKTVRKYPYNIAIELTAKCNSLCRMCPRKDLIKKKKMTSGDMDFKLFEKILDDCRPIVDEQTVFSLVGLGEPLMYQNLEKAIKLTIKKYPQAKIDLNSNGLLLDQKNSKMLIRTLRDKDRLLISLNAPDRQTYKWLMGTDNYEKVEKNIINLLTLRRRLKKTFIFSVQLFETKQNEKKLKAEKERWTKLLGKNDILTIRSLTNWGGLINTKKMVLASKGKQYPCYMLWVALVIDREGNVYPCCTDFSFREESDLKMGNVRLQNLIDIYDSKIKDFRKKHLLGNWREFKECRHCDVWSYQRSAWFKVGRRWY